MRVFAPGFAPVTVAPTGLALYHYIKVAGGFDAVTGTLTETGLAAIDVWACLLARCRAWEVAFGGSVTAPDGFAGSFTQTENLEAGVHTVVPGVQVPFPSQSGYGDHPEVTTATGQFLEMASGSFFGLGTWTFNGDDAGHWDVDLLIDWSQPDTGSDWLPLRIGADLYIPLRVDMTIHNESTDTSLYENASSFAVSTQRQEDLSEGSVPHLNTGTLTIEVPNWRGSGMTTLTMPLWNYDPNGSGGTFSFSITMRPVEGAFFAYGTGPSNASPRWNADGTINGVPGD